LLSLIWFTIRSRLVRNRFIGVKDAKKIKSLNKSPNNPEICTSQIKKIEIYVLLIFN